MSRMLRCAARAVLIAAGLTISVASQAAPISEMIGDNDGYGVGIADNGNSFTITANPNTDFRSAAETTATNGAQFTDVYSALYPGFGANTSFNGSFVFSPFIGILTSGSITIDMADFQSDAFGAFTADINGVALPFSFADGRFVSVVRTFNLTAAQLAAINNDGFVSLNLSRGGSGDFIAFDYVSLSGDVSVPGPMVGAGLPGLALAFGGTMLWWRRRQALRA